MENITKILDSLWLENNESIVYLESIKLWTQPASSISNRLNIPRSSARYTCEQLVKKWLMVSTTKANTKLFTAENPQKIKILLQVEKNIIEEKEIKLNKVMSKMLQMYTPYTKLPKVTFYEWEEWIKKVLWDSLTTKETIDSITDVDAIKGYLDNVNQKYVNERKKLKIKKRSIYWNSNKSKDYLNKLYSKLNNEFNEVKFIDSDKYKLYVNLMIYDNKVTFITLNDNSYMWVIIENSDIYNHQKNQFKFMWDHL